MKKLFLLTAIISSTLTAAVATSETSDLWGTAGELWDPVNGVKDFSDVGYMNGNVTLPDDTAWPNMVNVLDYGAVADDDMDDSGAFIAAIAACPPNGAIFVPKGRYIILQQIRPTNDYFVLRGEDMYATLLYFPKYLGEVYPAVYYDDSYGYKGGFFHIDGGTHRSIENLTFEFREQTKMGFWEFRGANAIKYKGDVTDSWIRNVHFRNIDFGVEFDGAERITVVNLYFTHYINRPAFVDASFYIRTAAYLGIGMGKMYKCLIHNIEYTGDMFHDFDVINIPNYNAVSRVTGPSIELRQHGMGAHHNLYTEAYCGKGFAASGLKDERLMHHETYWGIHRVDRSWPAHPDSDFTNALNSNHVFVGYAVDYPETMTETFYYENIDPALLVPDNIYLAQMVYRGKPLPQGPFPTPPLAADLTGDVRRLNPTDDLKVGQDPEAISIPFDGFLKFDLTHLQDLTTIARATLKISTKTRTSNTFTMTVASVADDSWTQDTLTSTPAVDPTLLDSVLVSDQQQNKWWDLDVTAFVQQEWASDKIVSFYVGNDNPGNYLGAFHSRESGNAPVLVIERINDPVPGAPAAPTGMYTTSENGHILLDWEDNTEADFSHYNVYRFPSPNSDHPVAQGLTMSEFTDISAQEDRGLCEMPSDTLYFYTVTAVDSHGYESVKSTEFVGNTLDAANSPPAFGSSGSSLMNAVANQPYIENIAASASDPESETLFYFKVSGPSWLNVAYDGSISGVPQSVGSFQIVVQVNAIGGRDQSVFNLSVLEPPPASPTSLPIAGPAPTPDPTNTPTVSPTATPDAALLSCSDCASLGFKVDVGGKADSLEVCGASTYNGANSGTCFPTDSTWQEAFDTCQSIGARLCTSDEIANFETVGTGCGYDTKLIWTSSECEPGKYYTQKGQGTTLWQSCTPATVATITTRCCGDVTVPLVKNCADLGFKVDVGGKADSLEVCGASTYNGANSGTCFPTYSTWQEAFDTCRSIGARLCTSDEIANFETVGTGCGYDTKLIWTSSECEPGKYYTQKGQGTTLWQGCTPATDATITTRCCGDVTVTPDCSGFTRARRRMRGRTL